jgi:alpha(1,3/1,4) fucosyltransferase
MKKNLVIILISLAVNIFGYDSIQVISHTPGMNFIKLPLNYNNSWSVLKRDLLSQGYELNNYDFSHIRKRNTNLIDIKNNSIVKKIIFNNLSIVKEERILSFLQSSELILVLWEPPTVLPQQYSKYIHKYFKKILTWDDDLVDNKKYFKFNYAACHPMLKNIVPYSQKKFCCMICANKSSKYKNELYSERRNAIQFFEKKEMRKYFDLFGWDWARNGYKNYKGQIPSKINVLKNYKFSICFENTKNHKGYVTEKIFDCFQAGVIPIYLGAPNVTDYIPDNCFIDFRKFKDYKRLFSYLKHMTQVEYETYIENIRRYLDSKRSEEFKKPYFEKRLLEVVVR